MISVPQLSWNSLDAWPVSESGLGRRATRVLTEHHIKTIGEVRDRLSDPSFATTPGLGSKTLEAIQCYVETCGEVVSGSLRFADLPSLLRRFLYESHIEILLRRYGLFRLDTASSRNFITLQDIGNELDLTRERVRQIEKQAFSKLRGRLQQHCLQPLYDDVCNALTQQGGILRCDNTAHLDTRAWLGGYKASSSLLLLHDISPTHYAYYHDTFSLISLPTLKRVEEWAIHTLEQATNPMPITTLFQSLPTPLSTEWNESSLAVFLAAIPTVLATRDQRFVVTDTALAKWAEEELDTLGAPTHYRRITQAINDRLQPHQQVGPRRILLLMHSNPKFAQTHSGHYIHRRGRASSSSEERPAK